MIFFVFFCKDYNLLVLFSDKMKWKVTGTTGLILIITVSSDFWTVESRQTIFRLHMVAQRLIKILTLKDIEKNPLVPYSIRGRPFWANSGLLPKVGTACCEVFLLCVPDSVAFFGPDKICRAFCYGILAAKLIELSANV